MSSILRSTALAAVLGLTAAPAFADTPMSGIGGLAMSPDGATLYAISESRGLYVLDPATLEIKERVWLRTSPVSIIVSADGAKLFIRDTSDDLYVMSASTYEVENTVGDVSFVDYAPAANLLFVGDYEYDRENKRNDTIIRALDAASLSEVGKVELDAEVEAIDVTPDASLVACLTDAFDVETEPKEDKPDGMSKIEREVWDHKHDEEEAMLIMLTDRGQTMKTVNLWYSDFSSPSIQIVGDKVWVAPYSGMVAKLDPASGEAELMEVGKVSYNYGAGFTDGLLMVGGLRSAGSVKLDTGEVAAAWELDSLPGWPEYFESFVAGPDGSVYAGTSASVVYKFDGTGAQQAMTPLF